MSARPFVGLVTDFGRTDTYVGSMHAVIHGLAPDARIVDLTHAVPAQNVAVGAWRIATAWDVLPPGAVVVGVVDPGVGSARRGVAARIGDRWFVGPDNGLVSRVADRHRVDAAWVLGDDRWHRTPSSATFHGRDVFAPVAGHIVAGVDGTQLGLALRPSDLVRLPPPLVERDGATLRAEIVDIDRFGNLITAARSADLGGLALHSVAGREIPRGRTFSDVAAGQFVAYVGSHDTVEVARRDGHAASALHLEVGDKLPFVLHDSHGGD